MPQRAFFVSPSVRESGGVDYLGLRQANLELMDQFMPGINNRTQWIRPYSVMCWAVWVFNQHCEPYCGELPVGQRFERFREKIEVLFGWSHQLVEDGTYMAGNGQYRPPGNGPFTLDFKSWHRGPSWFDAVQYGPSFKPDTGLGLAWPKPDGTYGVTEAGEALARALDKGLRRLALYPWLTSLEDLQGSVEQANAVHLKWDRNRPSAQEAQVFREEFYPPPGTAKNPRAGHRECSIDLIRATLQVLGSETSLPALRRAMALLPLSKFPAEQVAGLAPTQALWRVLQLRQAQRLAFESLFGWVEQQIALGLHSSEELRDRLLGLDSGPLQADTSVQAAVEYYRALSPQTANVLEAGLQVAELDLFERIDHLLGYIANHDERAASEALQLLFLVAAITQDLSACPQHSVYLDQGGQARLSLRYWARSLQRKQQISLSELVLNLIENNLLSQHFGIAAIRMTEAKPRLRISLEEQGLVSLLSATDSAWRPGLTEDRLYSTLALMTDSRLLRRRWCEQTQTLLYGCADQ
ncbi:hypothetical protein A9978_09720 [Pseudomonas sp. UMC65]|nr:hypothetical protein [Pseudomonas sp. UMC65]MBB1622968.1 hypothetical protein [Pseudomonas sp. UME65]